MPKFHCSIFNEWKVGYRVKYQRYRAGFFINNITLYSGHQSRIFKVSCSRDSFYSRQIEFVASRSLAAGGFVIDLKNRDLFDDVFAFGNENFYLSGSMTLQISFCK